MIVDIHKVIKIEQRVLCAITRFPCCSHLTLVWFVCPSYKYWCIALNHTPDIFRMRLFSTTVLFFSRVQSRIQIIFQFPATLSSGL